MSIKENINKIKENINSINKKNGEVTLVAVTKTVDIDKASQVMAEGITCLGENRVQEFLRKYEALGNKAEFHLIGHLQTNKVKYVVGKCKLIHSVDSLKILNEIEKQCKKLDVIQDILLQVNVSKEESKYGLEKEDVINIIKFNEENKNVKIKGLMTIAPFNENIEEIRWVFKGLYQQYIDIKQKTFYNTCMEFISMGMSNDYIVAIEEGANMVRLGSSIFR